MDKNYVCGMAFLMGVLNTCCFVLLLVGGIFGGLFSFEFGLSSKTYSIIRISRRDRDGMAARLSPLQVNLFENKPNKKGERDGRKDC